MSAPDRTGQDGSAATPRRRRDRARRLAIVGLLLLLTGLGLVPVVRYGLAEHHLRQATAAHARQRYRLALAGYEQAIRYRPGSAALHLLAGRTARQAGEGAVARDHLRRCRELQHGVSEEQQLEEYLLRAQTGQVDEVLPSLLPYLHREGPLTPLVLEALVRAYMAKYRPALAWQYLARWSELEPDNVEAAFRRATWFAQQQNIREAIAAFARVLELDPLRTEVRPTYAEILRADRRFREAAEQYRLAVRDAPDDPAALLGLAQAATDLGDLDEARQALAAIPEEQTTAEVLFTRGVVEMRSGRPEQAEPLLRQALQRDPGHFEACYNLMLCYRRLRRDRDADAMQERFRQIDADTKRLIAITTKELSEAPASVPLHCELGEVYLRLGHPQRGIHWLGKALQLDPTCRRAHERLRDHYERLGPEAADQAAYHRRMLAGR